uniref:Generative cell specific-1/HAP2 domain-containing protein n=1 Tax=Aegilops tauschii subsp. strangulata TaxID=200361 RepID=A0A453LDF2_AEGTS
MQTVRDPPVITINKSAVYALYAINYMRDVAYKPEEMFTRTHKCESDAGADVVGVCERFHVFEIVGRSTGYSIRVQVKKGSSVTEVIVSPENKTVVSKDNFLRVNLIGDFVSHNSMPTFEDFYLVTPRKAGGDGQPQVLGDEFSRWMLLERVRFTLDGLECNKIGVGYEAYRNQPNLCGSPFGSCLYNQLWNFKESDENRIYRNQEPQYIVQGRSPGKIIDINVPTFEALSQVGTAKVTIKNIGKLEASYSLTFDCLSGISYVEEQFFIIKPGQVVIRSFYLRSSSDQASKYRCSAILKASDFSELDRAECQFSTTATVLDNGTQIGPPKQHKKGGIRGFIEAIETLWRNTWDSVIDFFTGRSCSTKCSSFLDLSCHIQYICIGWLVMFGLLLTTLPAVAVLLWLLHQKGMFDPLYDCWEDVFRSPEAAHPKHRGGRGHHAHAHTHHHHHHSKHPHAHKKRSSGAAGQQQHHHHHHVLHRHGGKPDGEQHRHAAALGVQHRDAGHKHHRHGKAPQRERERAPD